MEDRLSFILLKRAIEVKITKERKWEKLQKK